MMFIKRVFLFSVFVGLGSASHAQLHVASGERIYVASLDELQLKENLSNSGTVDYVTMSGTSTQTISGTGTVGNIKLNNPGSVTISSGDGNMLTLTGLLTPTAGTLYTNGNLTLKSDANGTARVGVGSSSGGYISGNVVTQRHLTKTASGDRTGRAWRLVSIPVTGSGTLRDFFMGSQSGTDLTVDANRSAQPTHLGTVIIGHNYANASAATTAGFDWIGVANQVSSLRSYVADAAGGSFASSQVPTMSTTYTAAAQGYGVFVRGDRQTQYFNNTTNASTTTLQATGELKQGTQTVTIPALTSAGFVLVGNPYMSLLNLESVFNDGANSGVISNTIYVWDANIDGNTFKQGGYRTVTRTGPNAWTATGGGTVGSEPYYIESGVAFFVKPTASGGSLQIKEAHKVSAGNAGIQPLGAQQELPGRLFVNLEVQQTDTTRRLVDGVVAFFDDRYRDTTTDAVDINSISNLGTSALGLSRDGKRLAMEGRPWPVSDTWKALKLDMRSVGASDYTIRLIPSQLTRQGFMVVLKDLHLNKETEINKDKETIYAFKSTGNNAVDTARFEIVFRSTAAVVTSIPMIDPGSSSAIRLYPNPSKGEDVRLSLQGLRAGKYQVQVINMMGHEVGTGAVVHRGGNSEHSLPVRQRLPKGIYVVRVSDPKGNTETRTLVLQ